MGLLDDAIREHLELKRRHGADAEEVARQEREALGAPVRGEFAPPAGAPAASAPDSPDAPPEPVSPEHAEDVAGYEEEPWIEDAEPSEPEPGAEPDPPAEPETQLDPPAARAASAAPGEPADDVLEETPDFLQETPEHERLWFEQKPPRDFDWDK